MSSKAAASLAVALVSVVAAVTGWLMLDSAAAHHIVDSATLMFGRCAFGFIVLLLAVGFACVFRFFGQCPSELDRVGSDMSLYGYGIVLAFVIGLKMNRPVLIWVGSNGSITFVIAIALLLTMAFYLWNLVLSEQIRNLNRAEYGRGIESIEQLTNVLGTTQGRTTWALSLCLGFFPTYFLILADLAE